MSVTALTGENLSQQVDKVLKSSPYKNKKAKYWAFICYPDSVSDQWLNYLIQYGIKIAVSPLHDKDLQNDHLVLGDDGSIEEIETKKPHYHVILAFANTTTYKYVLELVYAIRGVYPVPLSSIQAYYRYFTHEDDPDKYQYDEKDIRLYNGFAIADFLGECPKEKQELLVWLTNFIVYNHVYDYTALTSILAQNEYWVELRVAQNNTLYFRQVFNDLINRRSMDKESYDNLIAEVDKLCKGRIYTGKKKEKKNVK